MTFRPLLPHVARLLAALMLAVPFLWMNGALSGGAALIPSNLIILLAALLAALDGALWQRAGRRWRSARILAQSLGQVGGFAILFVAWFGLFAPGDPLLRAVGAATIAALFGLSFVLRGPRALGRVIGIGFGLILALIIAEIGAGVMLSNFTRVQSAASAQPTQAAAPTDASTSNAAPAPTPSAAPPPAPTATPGPPRPIPGTGYVDYIVDGGQAEWSAYTGYGPRVNSIARAYMVDADGRLVYDTHLEFNSKGMRGPDVPYEKPADVYRILIVGDSFVEAVQVDYADTLQAALQAQLAQHNAPARRYEVIAMGRMGWGTLQEYLYYQVEGHKFNADLVILMFYINDVADNFPRFFYPGINNTNYDFVFEGESVRIIDTNRQALPPNTARRLYNALPPLLQGANLARLAVRLFDPPPSVRTPGGILDRVHPQFYIYVTSPEVEGYAEAWRRTEFALTHFTRAVQRNGAQFAVVPIFIGREMVWNVAGWWPELVRGWQWDDALPERRLAQILAGLPAAFVPTRPHFEQYAQQMGDQVSRLLFIPEDGHFNALGHRLTAEVIYNWLIEQGIVENRPQDR